jgi:serine phosphatase RsbU (regulator of sigma subunit)
MPRGHLPVRSYLAVPVIAPRTGEVIGGFFFGHPVPGMFTERHERLAREVARQAAVAVVNARLFVRHRDTAAQLQRSLLPTLPQIPDLTVVSRYLPAAAGAEVGGDWLDVIALPGGRTAFVVGDVMGKGVHAAAIMGQIRAAVRSYALLDLPPGDIMRHLSEVSDAIPDARLITCVYAVHDPVERRLLIANAGHLPPVLVHPDGRVEFLDDQLGVPLGIGETDYAELHREFPPGTALLLYTDGLVEGRRRPITDGLDQLARQLAGVTDAPETACDALIESLTGHTHDDDVALLYVRHRGDSHRVARQELPAHPRSAPLARRFVETTLAEWGLPDEVDSATLIATELVTNALRHAGTHLELRMQHPPGRLIIDVVDHDGRLPRLAQPSVDDEQHRGLLIVQRLASRWGARPTETGKIVWAELRLGAEPGGSWID